MLLTNLYNSPTEITENSMFIQQSTLEKILLQMDHVVQDHNVHNVSVTLLSPATKTHIARWQILPQTLWHGTTKPQETEKHRDIPRHTTPNHFWIRTQVPHCTEPQQICVKLIRIKYQYSSLPQWGNDDSKCPEARVFNEPALISLFCRLGLTLGCDDLSRGALSCPSLSLPPLMVPVSSVTVKCINPSVYSSNQTQVPGACPVMTNWEKPPPPFKWYRFN